MRNIRVYILVFLTALIGFSGCKRDIDEFVGPEVAVATGGFTVFDSLMVSDDNPDFSLDTVLFTAKFNERVSWEILIEGSTSTAAKTLTGTGDSISVNWEGRSDLVYFFREKEPVTAILSILGIGPVDTLAIEIKKGKVYEGYLINDFEGNGLANGSWWQIFKPNELVEYSDRYSNVLPPQGENSVLLKGIDVGPDGFLGQTGHSGLIDLKALDFPEDLDSLYFNCYVQGSRGSRLEIRFLQTVNDSPVGDEYSYFVNIAWDGWKLISVPYSDFNKTAGDGSSPIQKSNAITRTKFVLRTNTNGDPAEVLIDYPVFTIAKPFNP